MNTEKQLKDIHEEARRIADTHKVTSPPSSGAEPTGAEQPVPAPAVAPGTST